MTVSIISKETIVLLALGIFEHKTTKKTQNYTQDTLTKKEMKCGIKLYSIKKVPSYWVNSLYYFALLENNYVVVCPDKFEN